MELHLQTQLTAEDYVEARLLHGWVRAYIIYTLLILTIILLILAVSGARLNSPTGNGCVLGLAIALALGLKTVPRAVARRSRRIFAQQKSLHVTREILISDTTISSKSDRGDARLPWSDFYKWNGNDKIILLYPSENLFHMFPRRWFTSGEFGEFKDLLAQKVGPAGKPRTVPPSSISSQI
jgi:hypothetical protein